MMNEQEIIDFKGNEYTVKYIHKRVINDKEEIQVKGGKTIAYIAEKDNVMIATGEADCSNKDNYNKSIGRKIATGRLRKKIKKGFYDDKN